MKRSSLVAIVLLALIALAHLVRLVVGAQATVGGVAVPMWASGVGILVAGGVALLLWRDRRL